MQEILHTVVSVLRGIVRFRWVALVVAFTLAVISAAAVSQLPDKYEGRARVFVDSNRVLQPLLKGLAVQPDVNQRVRLMSRTLMSRPNMEKLVRMADIGVHSTTDYEKELQLNNLQNEVRLRGERGNTSLYTVTYTHEDPDVARRVVQSLITVFIESSLGDKRQDSESAQEFLGQQIRLYERRLAEAESRLSQFKRDNVGKMPSEAGGYYQRLSVSSEQLRNARLELGEVQNRILSLRQRLASEPRTIASGLGADGYIASPLDIQLGQQRQELSGLLLRYTDRHPKIAQLRSSISDLEAIKAQGGDALIQPVSSSVVANPVYQEVVKLLAEAEAEAAGLEVRVGAFEKQVGELNDTVGSIPKVEQQLAQLNRDYEVVKGQYEELLERRESARLSEEVELNVDDVKFRVIDPPFVPSRPSSPNKPLLTMAGFVAAIGGALALAWVISMLRPVFYDASSIAAKTGRPILGSVSNQAKTSQKQIALNVVFMVLCSLLALVMLIILAKQFGVITQEHLNALSQNPIGNAVQIGIDQFQSLVGELLGKLTGGGV